MLDAIDKKIIASLQLNAKTTIKELANKLRLTTSPVFERIKRLEKDGIIKGYSAQVDYHKIELGQMVFCNVSMPNYSPKMIAHFENKVKDIPEILECYHLAGTIDYQMKILVKNIESYYNFLQEFTKLDIVKVHSSMVVLKQVKNTTIVEL